MNFQFGSPWLLSFLFFVPALIVYIYSIHKRAHSGALEHSKTSMLRNLEKSWRIRLYPVLSILRLAVIVLVIIALARPQIVQGQETITGEGVEIALALDVSGSMASLDFEPNNRLEAAKMVIGEFISERQYDKIGLIIFSQEAFNMSPVTLDHNMLNRALQDVRLAEELGIEDGTAIGLGIANAANMLIGSEVESKIIILLTDGVNNAGEIDPLTAAEAAKALGIKIYTIGAAKTGQVPVPVETVFGNQQILYQESVIDEETLQMVSEITGGKYYRAEDTASLDAIYKEINELEKSQVEVQVFNHYFELFALVLVPVFLLILIEFVLRKSIFRKLP
jgi:Ca-activated chloride channel family protein